MRRTPEEAAVAKIVEIVLKPRRARHKPREPRRAGRPPSEEVMELVQAIRNGDPEMTTECLDAYTADIRATAMRHYCRRKGIQATISRSGSIIHAAMANG